MKTMSGRIVPLGVLASPGLGARGKLLMLYSLFSDSDIFVRKWSWAELAELLGEDAETLRRTRRRMVKDGRLEVVTRGADKGYRVPLGALSEGGLEALNKFSGKGISYVADESERAKSIGRERLDKLPDICLWTTYGADEEDLPDWRDLRGVLAWDETATWKFWTRLPGLVAQSKVIKGGTPDERMQAALEAISNGLQEMTPEAVGKVRDGRRYIVHAVANLLGKSGWEVPTMRDIRAWRSQEKWNMLRGSAEKALAGAVIDEDGARGVEAHSSS